MDTAQREQLREEGWCIVPDVLTPDELARARAAFDRGIEYMQQSMGSAFDPRLDPNSANQRIYNLPAVDPVFIELLCREDALEAAQEVVGPHVLISNFTANNALPGAGSMRLHSDQALVVPPPWMHSWAVNVIWCLDDVREANGATRYLPGSHRLRSFEDVPENAIEQTLAFEAPAGSFIVMEGRMWHTSGCNVTSDEQRRLLFAYYSVDFLRPQSNWSEALPQSVRDAMDDRTRHLFGLGPAGNLRIGGKLTRLEQV
ncbi:MAG: phytanoyl-CoA dioxygenase family protein [Novosphingobium sp.]|nr:phytanoyl-CoA dioxygenase family protein [Novosphingobium sp.]